MLSLIYTSKIDLGIFQTGYLNIVLRSLTVYCFIILAIRVFGKKELEEAVRKWLKRYSTCRPSYARSGWKYKCDQ